MFGAHKWATRQTPPAHPVKAQTGPIAPRFRDAGREGLPYAQAMMGHANIATTMRYQHYVPNQ